MSGADNSDYSEIGKRNNLQLELIRYRKKILTLFTFAKRRIQCNIITERILEHFEHKPVR